MLVDSAAQLCYTCSSYSTNKNGQRALLVTLRAALTSVLAEGETMATNHSTTSPAGNASPQPYEDHQKIVTLPAMARHVSRAELMKLINHLQRADRPASARVITCDFAPDDDGGEAA